jgi:peptidoglycan/xylan/chitin deacetylase (PgdA/CDA1 family)
MIYITGDVHSKKIMNWEQKEKGPNVKTALEFLKILKKYSIKSTLFINGICLNEEREDVKKMLDYDVELGGHTYDNFGKMNVFKSYIYRKLYKCVYGPRTYQEKDIKKTKKAFRKMGLEMKSWRTHCYGSNQTTFRLLSKYKVRYVSDLLGEIQPFNENNITHLPINTPPDQNTMALGPLRPENRDPFASCTKGRIRPEEWLEIIKKRISENEKNKKDSVLLLHPATMACADNYRILKELAEFIKKNKYKTAYLQECKLKEKV